MTDLMFNVATVSLAIPRRDVSDSDARFSFRIVRKITEGIQEEMPERAET